MRTLWASSATGRGSSTLARSSRVPRPLPARSFRSSSTAFATTGTSRASTSSWWRARGAASCAAGMSGSAASCWPSAGSVPCRRVSTRMTLARPSAADSGPGTTSTSTWGPSANESASETETSVAVANAGSTCPTSRAIQPKRWTGAPVCPSFMATRPTRWVGGGWSPKPAAIFSRRTGGRQTRHPLLCGSRRPRTPRSIDIERPQAPGVVPPHCGPRALMMQVVMRA
mmetsp:Transcript_27193/g.78373  ORF Transcript_27193/g.78373 Transcript_27193/m.78373 type:complete len:228 (-) Transcript_27193:133-816(-)